MTGSSLFGPFGSSSSGNSDTIYNADSSLSNDRELDGDKNDLTLTNIQKLSLESNDEFDIDAGTELNLRALNGDVDISATDDLNLTGVDSIRIITPEVTASNVSVGDYLRLVNTNGEVEWSPAPYEKIVIWAEESSALSNNQLEWSFGNGAAGLIGIPLPEDWEVYAFSFQADVASAGAVVTMALVNIANNTNITTFQASGATNNMIYTELITPVISLPAGTCIGFRTVTEAGTVSDARVAAWLRRQA